MSDKRMYTCISSSPCTTILGDQILDKHFRKYIHNLIFCILSVSNQQPYEIHAFHFKINTVSNIHT